ncbi:hypothetical protein AB0M64_18260 [Streptomyces sp. NPDC051771]|uniref:hypothetical protein n=1 Tax=Streptomyces sp. NPDC051771 TaxID=3154847 RepID=UPI003444CDBE
MSTEKEQTTEPPPPVAAAPRPSRVTDRLTGQDVARVVAVARHYGRRADRHLAARRGRRRVGGPARVREARVPRGTVGAPFPRNHPLCLGGGDVLQARLDEAEPPAGVRHGAADDGAAGTSLGNAGDFVCFTRPAVTGRDVAERAARRLVGSSLELGCSQRPVVRAEVYDLFRDRLVRETKAPRPGRPCDSYASDHGSLVSPARLATVGAQAGRPAPFRRPGVR